MPLCPVCGTENPDVARFCLACGAALTAEPRREERKVVTVLFADLVGFTSRAEQLDPEDVRAVLAPYWERLRSELEKRGGTVEKFIGDAVMALFGAPVAHDDDPLRAVGAALAIRDWAREEADVQVRIAVNTGEALVLLGARPGEGEGMAAGDVVNTAARLQSAAPVNGVLVGETTYRATRDVIEYAEHEPVTAKGKTDPIPVWEAVQVRSRLGMDVDRSSLPLVGRRRELAVIVDAFERAKSEREPQLVTLVGVPGIGKSRLLGGFFSHLESSPDLVWWRQGRALPYGDGVSFWAVAEMVKAQAGIDENDAEDVAERKLRASVDVVVDEPDRAWVADHLLPLVGGEHRGSGESVPAWRTFFEGLAEQRPLVLVFEDMHWADDGLLDFIDHLVDWATGVPLLVIATARPELLDRRAAWGGGKLNVSTIALTPLTDEESAQIIHNVLEQAVLPAATQQALLERAGGNPLYAEQFARLYMERGSADDLPLPETVQGLIAARLDGLSAEEKRIAQDAAVFGKVFWGGALDADEAALHSLERKGIIRRERRSSVGGETQYAFRHVLLRDVAYGQIPRAARGDKHVRAADWIERLGRAEDHAELVAHHLSSAAEYGADTGERLRIALRRAGERAVALGAHPAAERYFAQALAAWPEDDPERALVLAGHARAHANATGDLGELVPALDALEAAGLREQAAQFAAHVGNAVWRGGTGGALPVVERGLALLEGLPPSPALAHLRHEEARIRLFQGDVDRASADLAAAVELAEHVDDAELRAEILATQAVVTIYAGDVAGALELSERALSLAPPWSDAEMRCLTNLSVFAYTGADRAAADMWLDRGIERATRSGDLMRLRWLEAGVVGRSYELGDWDDALRRADADLSHGPHYNDQGVLLVSGMIHASRGALDEARRRRDRAIARADEQGDQQATIPTRMAGAWISHLVGDGERCRQLAGEALRLMEDGQHRAPAFSAMGPCAVVHAGRAADMLRVIERCAPTRRVEAVRLVLGGDWLAAAERWALISPNDEALARVHAAAALAAEGRIAEAELQLERGLAFFRAVGARRIIELFEAPLRAAAAAE